ncbi:MAG TPA: TraR/DksA C4-type zinc finger protein [Acidimicrobiales bacterium]
MEEPADETAILDRVEADLADVDRALELLDRGTYGRCEVCGEPVGDDLLTTVPVARACSRHSPDTAT